MAQTSSQAIGLAGPDHRNDALDHLRIGRRPFIGLQRAHRRAGNRIEFGDAEIVEQRLLHIDEIANADERKIRPVRLARVRIDRGGTGRHDVRIFGVQIDERIGCDDEKLRRVDGLAGPDDRVPIARQFVARRIFSGGMAGAREEMRDQDRVRFIGIQRPVAFPADLHILDRRATRRLVGRHRKCFLFNDHVLRERRPCKRKGGRKKGRLEQRVPRETFHRDPPSFAVRRNATE